MSRLRYPLSACIIFFRLAGCCCLLSLLLSGAAIAQSRTLTYSTPGIYTLSVGGGISVSLTTKGGDGASSKGGSGATVGGLFTTQSGDVLTLIVGGVGGEYNDKGGGGGGSAIILNRGGSLSLLLAAGGGGGANAFDDLLGGGGQGPGYSGGGRGGNGDDSNGGGGGGGGLTAAGTNGAAFRFGGGGGQASLTAISPGGSSFGNLPNGGSGFGGGGGAANAAHGGGGGGGGYGGGRGGDRRGFANTTSEGGYSYLSPLVSATALSPGTTAAGLRQNGFATIEFPASPASARIRSSNTTVCAGQPTSITGTIEGSVGTWTLFLSDGTSLTGTGNTFAIPVTPASSTTYTIQNLFDNRGIAADNATLGTHIVTVSSVPVPFAVSGGGTLCAGGAGVAVGLAGSETGVSYQLLRNGSPTGNLVPGTGSALSFGGQTQGGTYTVRATTPCQQPMSGSVTVTVNSLPTVTVTAAPSATLTCAVPSVTLTAQTSATAFVWSNGGSTAQSLPVSQTGTYSITVTDGNGCTAVSNSVSISQDKISPSVSVSATGSVLTCAVPSVTLTATSSATALRWSTNATTGSIPVSQTGTYSVTATGANGCTAVSNSVSISQDVATPSVSVSATGNVLTCAVPLVTLTATSSATALHWSTNATTGSIPVSQTGTYSVTATGANGCTAVSNAVTIGIDLSLPPFTVRSATACQGQTVSLLAEGCPGQVVWSGGTTGVSIQLTAGVSGSALTATCTVGSCSTMASGSVVIGGLLPPPAQILSLRSEESGCPVQLIGQGVGTSFVFTGSGNSLPGGYVFSNVFRKGSTYDLKGTGVTKPGVYTLTATYTNECGISAPVSQTVTVGRSCP